MYKLFTKHYEINNGVVKPAAFDYIKRIYQRELEKIKEYYASRVYAVKSNHLLCRILTTATAPMSYELNRYVEVVIARSPYIAKHFNLTSEINYGTSFDGVFYGYNNIETIISYEEYFDALDAFTNWKKVQAVKVLMHPFSDLGLQLPNGKVSSIEYGNVTVAVNIPLLLVQYRGFVMQQYGKLENADDSLLAVSHFVHMYVLPNMLDSHLELVILNRMMNLQFGAPMGQAVRKHPFPIIDYSSKLDKVLEEIHERISHSRRLYSMDLKNIPSISYDDMQESLIVPDLAPTRQVWWAIFYSRLKVMKYLIDVGGNEGVAYNRDYINRLQIDIKRFKSEKIFDAMLDKDTLFELNDTFENILAI